MYKIIDDFLSKEDFLNIKNTLFPQDFNNPNNFSWYYHDGIVRDPKLGPTGYEKDDWMYNRLLYSSENKLSFDKYYFLVKPILKKLQIKNLFVVRANLLVPTKEHIYHEFHVDRKIPHKVALFYVTDCNGFTILKDNGRIDCKSNRMLIFDGSIEHHSVTSTNFPRSVININFN